MARLTRKRKYEEVRWSLARSNLAVRCAGVYAFRFPIVGVLGLVAITTMHCTVHMTVPCSTVAWRHGVVAWARAIYQYHVNGTDTVGRLDGRSVGWMVGRSVDARGPIDHASVGLAQAHPKNT